MARYLVLSISLGSGGNRLWYLPLAALPVNASTGCYDLGRFDMRLPAGKRAALPLAKLVDDLRATWAVVATNGTQWTLHTSYNAPRYRCGPMSCAYLACPGTFAGAVYQHVTVAFSSQWQAAPPHIVRI